MISRLEKQMNDIEAKITDLEKKIASLIYYCPIPSTSGF